MEKIAALITYWETSRLDRENSIQYKKVQQMEGNGVHMVNLYPASSRGRMRGEVKTYVGEIEPS